MTTNDLNLNLQKYTGITAYHKLYPKVVLTDDVKFLNEEANCFWLRED